MRVVSLFLCAAALFALDFFSKSYVHQHIPLMNMASSYYPYDGIPVFYDFLGVDFSINYVMNRGAAWGAFASLQIALLYLRIAIIAGMLIHLFFFNTDRFRQLPFTLILTGAIANVFDYYRFGHVVDMFHFKFGSYTFPLFNIADSAIFCGVALFILKLLWDKSQQKPVEL
jgi:signal peptidase II